MNKEQILKLKTTKHIKIYKLSQIGLSKKDIANELETNYGHVYNVIKRYDNDKNLRDISDSIT